MSMIEMKAALADVEKADREVEACAGLYAAQFRAMKAAREARQRVVIAAGRVAASACPDELLTLLEMKFNEVLADTPNERSAHIAGEALYAIQEYREKNNG